jgi:hypothetical protein
LPRSNAYLLVPFVVIFVWGLSTGEYLWFLTSVVVFVLSLSFYMRANDREQRHKKAAEIKRLLGKIRHDRMNDVQVLMGYQMMKRDDKVSEYLERMAAKAGKERKIAELTDESLVTYLLTISYLYPQWEWEVDRMETYVDSLIADESIIERLSSCIQTLVRWGEGKYDWQKVVLQLAGDENGNFFAFQVFDANGKLVQLVEESVTVKMPLELEDGHRLRLRVSR